MNNENRTSKTKRELFNMITMSQYSSCEFNFSEIVCRSFSVIVAFQSISDPKKKQILGELITTSIRPTVFYGEEDPYLFPTLAKLSKKMGGIIPKILGAGGKHQMTYVGMQIIQFFSHANSLLKQTSYSWFFFIQYFIFQYFNLSIYIIEIAISINR